MSELTKSQDYSKTLFLPRTDFPMRASLPAREPEILRRWQEMDLYAALRRDGTGRPSYILHDGPPYANGHIHIGHALNKVLKDVIVRSFQMRGFNANYVPGWDCHGLPIEWKIEEKYRSEGKNKDEVPVVEFRRQCREFATYWIKQQTEEFKRLGVIGDFDTPYTTMAYHAEARIASELMKFAESGMIYRGSKPVMWSVVERTALAEAEIEYHEVKSDMIWVKFAINTEASQNLAEDLTPAFIIIWTTTPWTIPGNRAVSYHRDIAYALYEIEGTENDYGPQLGERVVLAEKLAENCALAAKIHLRKLRPVANEEIALLTLIHPLQGLGGGYNFKVPLLDGHHVTDEAGTGFVHTAPSHGREDFDIWTANRQILSEANIDPTIPFPVDDAGFYTADAPAFGSDRPEGAARVIDDHGKTGDANRAVIEQLVLHNRLFARGRITHDYPHSWRSKKPVIFRNTPQWFIAMDKNFDDKTTLRQRALRAIGETRFVPPSGQARLQAMIEAKPDWVLSRQRSWGVPIPIFAREDGEILIDEQVNARILAAFEAEGADAWFKPGAREKFLNERQDEDWQMVTDVLDVWFDSGSTHSFTLEDRPDLDWPADLYLEGSDQHRGWFHSSLLESCGTRGRAPYKAVLTHGFTLDEKGRKMSKSLGNTINPQEIIKNSGADILRLWVMMSDYWEDQRLGQNTIQTAVDSYRKIRNVMRWMLGTLAHNGEAKSVEFEDLPELERLMLHRLYELDRLVRTEYDAFDFKRIIRALLDFSIVDLSAFYFDIRKDALYCEPPSSIKRKAALQVIQAIFEHFTIWLAPMLPFTTEEAWGAHFPAKPSIHLEQFPCPPQIWRNEPLAARWQQIRRVRRVVTGALEQARAAKKIGSSLEASPRVFVHNANVRQLLDGVDMAEICITSGFDLDDSPIDETAFFLEEISDVAVKVEKAQGTKCARSWRYTKDVGLDPLYPDVSARDAAALRELQALGVI